MAERDEKYDALNVMTEIFNYRKINPTRLSLQRLWFRNILYYMGEQWIEWFSKRGTFSKNPRLNMVPTPVANKIRDALKSEKALILNKNYIPRVWPNSNEPKDIEASEIAEMLIQDMDAYNDEEFKDEKEAVVDWMLLTGVGIMRTFPDMERGDYGIDSNGEMIKSGIVTSESTSPFCLVTDPLGVKLRDMKYVGICSFKDKEWVEDNFKVIVANAANREEMQYQHTLMKFVGNVSPWKLAGLNISYLDEEYKNMVEFKEMEFKPTKTFPKGRYIVMANDQIVIESEQLPLPMKKNQWMYSLDDFHYSKIQGRFWSDSFVNDIISPQDGVNQIDQTLVMNRKSTGRPRVILPIGTQIKRLNEHGESFLVLEYDPRLSG
ncbi:unnamed protein product, partial [marine sediment metagenome]